MSLTTVPYGASLVFGLDPSSGAPLAYKISADAVFLAGLISRATVERDVNAAASVTSRHGGVPPDWRPVPGLTSVPCRITPPHSLRGEARAPDGRPGAQIRWRVLLGWGLPLDFTYRFRVRDRDAGRDRYLKILTRVVNAHDMDHHWVADCEEIVG